MAAPDLKKVWLIIISLCFVAAGISLSWYSLEKVLLKGRCWANGEFVAVGEVIEGYRDGKECVCNESKILCEGVDSLDLDSKLTPEDFSRKDLDFETRYITSAISEDLSRSPLSTSFKSIQTEGDDLEIVLEQAQLCTNDMQAPIQIGMYHASKSALTLTLVVNSVAAIYTQPCTVEARFVLNSFKYEPGIDYALRYRSEDGQLLKANACVYNDKLFNNEDRYEAIDECNICQCVDGISRCTNDRVCE